MAEKIKMNCEEMKQYLRDNEVKPDYFEDADQKRLEIIVKWVQMRPEIQALLRGSIEEEAFGYYTTQSGQRIYFRAKRKPKRFFEVKPVAIERVFEARRKQEPAFSEDGEKKVRKAIRILLKYGYPEELLKDLWSGDIAYHSKQPRDVFLPDENEEKQEKMSEVMDLIQSKFGGTDERT
jgi:phage pi2 protein 07